AQAEPLIGRHDVDVGVVQRTVVGALHDAVLKTTRQRLDILSEALARRHDEVLDLLTQHRLAIDDEDTAFHLDLVARQPDDALDGQVAAAGHLDDHDLAACRRNAGGPQIVHHDVVNKKTGSHALARDLVDIHRDPGRLEGLDYAPGRDPVQK